MSYVTLNGTYLEGGSVTLDKCIDFEFSKDRYSATQEFSGKFISSGILTGPLRAVVIEINSHTVLTGYVEKQESKREASGYTISIKAKSYSSMLEYNHVQPGLYPSLTFASAFTQFAGDLHGITCGGGNQFVNYINCPDWTTIFDVLAHTSVRAYDTYPYVTMDNCIRSTLPGTIPNYNLTWSQILNRDEKYDTSSLISTINMKDINDNVAAYSRSCAYTQSLGIVRVKYISLMYDWLYDPEGGLDFKLNMARRRSHTRSLTYLGYNGEDVYSQVTFPQGIFGNVTNFFIHAIKISGNDKKIETTLTYFDDYYSNMTR